MTSQWSLSDLAPDWRTFLAEYAFGNGLAYSREQVETGLAALRSWDPNRYSALREPFGGGLSRIASAVDTGLTLATCADAGGAPSVIARLVAGDRSARAELTVAATLANLGYQVRFAAPCDAKLLDVAFPCGSQDVFVEVASPEPAERTTDHDRHVRAIEDQLKRRDFSAFVELELLSEPTSFLVSALETGLSARLSVRQWHPLAEGQARLRLTPLGDPYPDLFDRGATQVRIGGDSETVTSGGQVVTWNETDDRAKRVFNDEYQHFSDKTVNILALNVSAVPGGLDEWPRLLSRLLQPGRNRRVGAVLLYDQCSAGPPERIVRKWASLLNAHAHHALPDKLAQALQQLPGDASGAAV